MHTPTAHQLTAPWSLDDTEKFLSDNPLPEDFLWWYLLDFTQTPIVLGLRGKRVELCNGRTYGEWFRGNILRPCLFEEVHDVVLTWKGSAELPRNGGEIAAELNNRRNQGTLVTEEIRKIVMLCEWCNCKRRLEGGTLTDEFGRERTLSPAEVETLLAEGLKAIAAHNRLPGKCT